ncbi:hypothetical protein HHI36_011197 [Cryptolaemus montrouzieri]|uniref:Uncharacterized protein n=1 Tax=Cryptolaemus montrouzieri TaxID=559131 RepID=A0ABD2MLW1_9CUCU
MYKLDSASNEYSFENVHKIGQDVNRVYSEILNISTNVINVNCPTVTVDVNKRNDGKFVDGDVVKAGEELKDLFWLKKNLKDEQLSDLYRMKKKEYKLLLDKTKKD